MKKNLLFVMLAALSISIGTEHARADTSAATDRETPDYASVLERAQAGDPSAQFQAGLMHERGQGVPQAAVAAVAWYRRAADQGHALAQHDLAVMYEQGEVLAADTLGALAWYLKAADQGLAESQFNAGLIYEFGGRAAAGAAKDQATKPGSVSRAQADMAEQLGDVPDRVQARKWYLLAAESGYAPAQLALKRVTSSMADWERAESDRLAAEWRVARDG